MDSETAAVTGHDVTAITCVRGLPMRIYTPCVPHAAAVYRDSVIEETGTAPVAFRVDVSAGPIAEALEVHWNLST
jgi:hypothetical protein